MDALISIIIPVYNTQEYLKRCIVSVQDNTYTNLEIICVNDGSKDNSLAVLQSLAEQDSRIKVIDTPNGGVSSARNAGLDAATGEYIAFIDSDDWVHKDYFRVLLDNIGDADLVVGNYKENASGDVAEKNVPLPQKIEVHNISVDEAVSNGFVRCSPCGRLYRATFVGEMRFPAGLQYGEDAVFNVALLSQKGNIRIVRVDALLYFYYIRPGSLTRSVPVDMLRLASESYLYHASRLDRKDLCLYQAFRMALLYRYQGFLTDDRRDVRKKANILLKECRNYLRHETNITAKTKLKLTVASYSATLYRLSLLLKDKTYRAIEKNLKE